MPGIASNAEHPALLSVGACAAQQDQRVALIDPVCRPIDMPDLMHMAPQRHVRARSWLHDGPVAYPTLPVPRDDVFREIPCRMGHHGGVTVKHCAAAVKSYRLALCLTSISPYARSVSLPSSMRLIAQARTPAASAAVSVSVSVAVHFCVLLDGVAL